MHAPQAKTSDSKNSYSPAASRDPGLALQPKLAVGDVNDPLEAEADAMADRIMRMPDVPLVQRKCGQCEDEEQPIQLKPLISQSQDTKFIQTKSSENRVSVGDAVSSRIQSTRGHGSALSDSTRSFMESRFGTDLGNVKIHTDPESAQINRDVNALAFTVGNDIYFNEGLYQPNTDSGQHLLAHELTHTLQQGCSEGIIRRQPSRTSAQQVATTLRNAAAGWGTDEDAIFNALTGRTSAEISDIAAAYLSLSGTETLEAMLRDELSGDDLSRALSLLRGETPATEIARTLWNAMRGWGTDESAIYAAIAGHTAAQWTDIQAAFRQMSGNTLLAELRDELTDDEWAYVQTLLPGSEGGAVTAEDRATVIANQLEAAMQGLGTDESAIYAALTGHSESELREIERKYRLITGHELNTDLREELSDDEYEKAQQLLHPPGLPERIARSLRNAVQGPGTREAEIVAILQGRSAAEITQVSAAYQRLYDESLNDRLRDELGGADWLETSILMSGRVPDVLEEILISTMDIGTDEERLLAALATLNRDLTLIRQLKRDYLARTGNTLRADLISELDGSDLSRALDLIKDGAEDTADEMTGMLGSRMSWRGSGPGSGTTFEVWASASSEGTAPTLTPSTIINCWEVVLLAAYRANAISWQYIHNLYTNIPTGDWVNAMSGSARTIYHVGGANPVMPRRGDVVFFNNIDHVALATGNGSEVLTFWPPPDTPFIRNALGAVEDRVKIFTIEALNQYWLDHPGSLGPPPVIEFARPAWQ